MAVLPKNVSIASDDALAQPKERRKARIPLYLTPSLDKRWRSFCEKYRLSVNEGAILAMEAYLKAVDKAEAKRLV